MTQIDELPITRRQDYFLLENASWRLYELLLEEASSRRVLITYDQGRLELMSPLPEHEAWKKRIARLIEILTLELDIAVASFGSTTYKRRSLARGLEPDECYYIQNERLVRGKKRIDLRRDPPPDLVVEIDITHHAIDRESIYLAMRVPELWRFDGQRLVFLVLEDEVYTESPRSAAFPFLRPRDLKPFLDQFEKTDETSVARAFQKWVRQIKRD